MRLRRGTAVALFGILAALAAEPVLSQVGPGPRFRADGPEADSYGRKDGYPRCTALTYIRETACRVGALSHYDALFPARVIPAGPQASPLRRAPAEPEVRFVFNGETRTLDQYLDTNHVTGFLIAKGDTILVERYQYGRSDKDRFTTFSVAKSVIGLLIGIAVEDGAIRSIDEPAEAYVPGLRGTEYGRTSIKALLRMTSGVSFRENYSDPGSDIYTLANLTLGQDPGGSVAAVKRFNTREAEPGQRFSYSSAESLVLGLVLAGATRRTVADYASEKLWVPLGAEAAASWNTDGTGQEITFAYVNAVLRDWARLGLMLAHDGVWQGRTIVPKDWLRAATSVGPDSPFWSSSHKPGDHVPGYGFQFWLPPTKDRAFFMVGLRGQFVLIHPEAKLVIVQTALRENFREGELLAMFVTLAAQLK
jgi:CubicO group peptidase (beta-lactamase class C family)